MPTIADAVLADDSDPEDQDYEGSGVSSEPESEGSQKRRRKSKKGRANRDKAASAEAEARATSIWVEMQAMEVAAPASGRGPMGCLSDPLWTQLQRRHPPPIKKRSRSAVWELLGKHRLGIVASEEASAVAAAAEATRARLKRDVRAEVAAARQVASTSGGTGAGARTSRPRLSVAAVLRRAQAALLVGAAGGDDTAVAQAAAVPNHEAQDEQEGALQKKCRRGEGQAQPGSQGSASPPTTGRGTVRDRKLVDKADEDWQGYKDRLGLDGRDLVRDRTHAGALERRAFLARTAARTEASSRVSARAAARQRVAAAARSG